MRVAKDDLLKVYEKKNGVNFIKDEIIDIHEIDNSPKLSGKYYSYAFEKLIVASGPWTKKLLGNSIKIDVYPSKGQIVKLRDPDNKFTDLHLHGSCSVIKKKDDLIWIAATSEEKGFDKTNEISEKDLLSQDNLYSVSYTHLTLPTKRIV